MLKINHVVNLLFCLTLLLFVAAGCGGGGGGAAGGAGNNIYQDIDEILETPEAEIDIADGTHLPEVFAGAYELKKIRTVTKDGLPLGYQDIEPSATINVRVSSSEPYDLFEASSNLVSRDMIEVSGLVSLDADSSRLIVEIGSSNTAAIAEGETYCLYFGASGGSGFSVSIEGSINGEIVDQIYEFDKIE